MHPRIMHKQGKPGPRFSCRQVSHPAQGCCKILIYTLSGLKGFVLKAGLG